MSDMAWIRKFEAMAKRMGAIGRKKASFCEQKEAKKLYLIWAWGVGPDTAHGPA
jgi:hypothetical protein